MAQLTRTLDTTWKLTRKLVGGAWKMVRDCCCPCTCHSHLPSSVTVTLSAAPTVDYLGDTDPCTCSDGGFSRVVTRPGMDVACFSYYNPGECFAGYILGAAVEGSIFLFKNVNDWQVNIGWRQISGTGCSGDVGDGFGWAGTRPCETGIIGTYTAIGQSDATITVTVS